MQWQRFCELRLAGDVEKACGQNTSYWPGSLPSFFTGPVLSSSVLALCTVGGVTFSSSGDTLGNPISFTQCL